MTIGRLSTNDIVINDRWISRRHARIRRDGMHYVIQDLESKNGLFVNGKRVTGPVVLQDGDQIQIAPRLQLAFVDSEETAPVFQLQQGVMIDEQTRQVWIQGIELQPPLSTRQFALLSALADAPERVFSRDELIGAVWPDEDPAGISDEAVNSLVRRLRKRLQEIEPGARFILAVRGHGFRFRYP